MPTARRSQASSPAIRRIRSRSSSGSAAQASTSEPFRLQYATSIRARSSCRRRAVGSSERPRRSAETSSMEAERAASTSPTRRDSASSPARSSATSRSCSRARRSRSSSAPRRASVRLRARSPPMSWVRSAVPPQSGHARNTSSGSSGSVKVPGAAFLASSAAAGRTTPAARVLRKREPSRERTARSNGRSSNTRAKERVEGMRPRSRQSSRAAMTTTP